VIARARDLLPADERVLAVYLIGSYATGQADPFSDVDVHLVVTDDSADWYADHWDDVLRQLTGPTVLVDALPGLIGGLGITADWLHVDLIVHPLASFDRFQYDGVRVLFDRDGTLFPDGDIPPSGGQPGEPYWPARTVRLFYYFIGNLVVVLGRDERIVGSQGVAAVRDQLIDLMLAERGIHRTSGAKRLNFLLTPDQRATLEAIPASDSTPESIITANRYIAHHFLTRATTLAAQTNTPWPTPFVEATLTHLETHFGGTFR
jgi:predicted nucleotidyltransferase